MKQFVSEIYSLGLTEKRLLKKRILCSFSGGQDSTLVFFALFHQKKLNQTINLVYFHHFWQIQNFQASKGIFYLSFNLKVPYTIIMSNLFLSNENRSRMWRKINLFRLSNLQQNSIILTGHTQTDRVETNLTYLIRGTSSKGVSSFNSFRELGEAIFNSSQNSSCVRFSSLAFSTSFVVLRLLTQPKQVKVGKKLRPMSKILFSNTNLFPTKPLSVALEKKFSKSSNLTIETRQNFNKDDLSKKQGFGDKRQQKFFESKIQKIFIKRRFRCHTDKQFLQVQNKSNKFLFWKKEEINFSQNVKTNKLLYICFRNGNSITKSHSFCFFKFSKKRTNNLKTPLKNQTRITVSTLTKIYRLPLFQDLTNFSSYSSRNKIRHIVFPLIGSLFQKKIDLSLTQFFSTLRYDIAECENFSQKLSFLLDFFSTPSACYIKISKNSNNVLKQVLLPQNESFGTGWVVFGKETKAEAYELFLLLYVCQNSERNFHSYVIKKIINNYTEREVSYHQVHNIKKMFTT